MPAFVLKRIQAIFDYTDGFEIYAIEHNFHGDAYVVQRNQIKALLGDRFYSMFENKIDIMNIINDIQPDIVHIDDVSERFDRSLITALYNNDRRYRIIETPHDVMFNPNDKLFFPDLYMFCSVYHEDTYADHNSVYYTIQYPIENKMAPEKKYNAKLELGFDLFKKNVINVGLFTEGKNQGEGFEIARKYPDIDFHFIGNMAENFSQYWKPLMDNIPSNVKLWGERDDIDKFMIAADVFMFNSINECSPIVLRQAVSYGLPIIARNLPTYAGMYDKYIQPLDADLKQIKRNYKIPNNINTRSFALEHQKAYKAIIEKPIEKHRVSINVNFIGLPFLEIKGVSDSDFLVKFYDEKNKCYYTNTIKSNHWIRLNRQWFTRWTIRIWENGELIYKYTLDLEGTRVFIAIDSKSLGDTLAWIPYVEEFRNKHNCTVICSTFWNKILNYPDLEFVEPGTMVNCYAMYMLGYFHDSDKEPVPANKVPLQQCASNVLGLDFEELVPRVRVNRERLDLGRYVTIATNSTAQCKFWTRSGWQTVINYLHSKGYRVINVSKEANPFDNCEPIADTSIEYTMQVIAGAEFQISLSSGLSWLAFAIGTHVVLISNFTASDYEFTTKCTRIVNTKVCHDCWSEHKLDSANWNWCPRNQNFICHTSITPEMVIQQLPL